MKYIGIWLLVLAAMLGLGWVLSGNQLMLNRFFLPANEQVRRATFEESKAYRQGMVQELQNMEFQYQQADPEHKTALASLIRHRAADFPHDDMPPDLRNFIEGLPQ